MDMLYIKGEQCIEVKHRDVTLGDVITMECAREHIIPKLKTIKILKMPDGGRHRYVISILKVIEYIHKEYPSLAVQNLGATDLIVVYEGIKKERKLWNGIKVAFVTLITFFGSAFAIATFNNDSGIPQLFEDLYPLIMGTEKNGFTLLELSYSIGIILGILIFFNHFGKKKMSVDPTPLEVEMRLYENDIYTTVIAEQARKGQELDVGKADTSGSHGA